MIKKRVVCLLLALALCFGLCACSQPAPAASQSPKRQAVRTEHTAIPTAQAIESNASEEPPSAAAVQNEAPPADPQIPAATPTPTETPIPQATLPTQTAQSTPSGDAFVVIPYNGEQIPVYTGEPYVSVNNGTPFFVPNELTDISYETYGDMDDLGRCTAALASIGTDLMPTEKRQSIQEVKPSGWNQAFYDIVDSEALYNRCHLIGYQLTAENANPNNLITGTRYMNTEGMLPFENLVADYIRETDNHVLYRVTPIFVGDELVARGVLMEGQSVEDDGDGVLFCEFIYNVQPGIGINYTDGASWLEEGGTQPVAVIPQGNAAENAPAAAAQETQPEAALEEVQQEVATQEAPVGRSYILNTNTHKFHDPSCSSVSDMNPANKEEFTGSRDEAIARGYVPCKRCNP